MWQGLQRWIDLKNCALSCGCFLQTVEMSFCEESMLSLTFSPVSVSVCLSLSIYTETVLFFFKRHIFKVVHVLISSDYAKKYFYFILIPIQKYIGSVLFLTIIWVQIHQKCKYYCRNIVRLFKKKKKKRKHKKKEKKDASCSWINAMFRNQTRI